MALVLKNMQKAVKLNMRTLEKNIKMLRKIMKIERFDVSVVFVTNSYIQNLNETYRNVPGPTDVLAFADLEVNY
jgi:ssRNA-specific RNase YbeY (16S rRNA maturation enzyme)